MNTAKKILPFFILLAITIFFFRNYLVKGLIPFPGDLLLSEYQPFRSYSYHGYVAGAIPNKAQYFDVIREFYPWRKQVISQLQQGTLPFWNPYNASGTPLLANFQSAVFYPFNLLFLLLKQPDAWAILVMLQPLLASLFTYLYSRKIGINSIGAIIASIAFAYCSYANVWLEFNTIGHTILWLPLALYGIELIVTFHNKWGGFIFLFTSILFSLLAGHPIDFGVIYVFIWAYGVFRLRSTGRRTLVPFVGIMLAPLGIGIVQLLPTAELVNHSVRSFFTYDFFINHMLIQPYQLIMLLIPDFFGNPATRNYALSTSYVAITLSIGLIPFILAMFAIPLALRKKTEFFMRFFLGSALTALLLTVRHPLTELLYRIQIPVISTNSPTKVLSIFVFSCSILAGFGYQWYVQEKSTGSITRRLLPTGIILTTALIAGKWWVTSTYPAAFRNSLFSGIIFLSAVMVLIGTKWIRKRTNKTYFALASSSILIMLIIFELHYAFAKFNPFVPKEFVFPKAPIITFLQENTGINRFWGYGTASIDSNIASYYGIFSPDGFDALNLRWYSQFMYSSKNGTLQTVFDQSNRSVAEIAPGYGEDDLPGNKYRLRVLDALGVKFILDRIENPQNNDTFPTERFKLVWSDDAGWRVFENLKTAPRFFLTRDVKTYDSTAQFETLFFADDFNPHSTILLTSHDAANVFVQLSATTLADTEEVKLISYQPNKVLFTTITKASALLYLSDTFDFGWKASIDGNNTPVIQANYAFRAVLIPEGVHEVVFNYKPSIYQFIL